MTDTRALSSSSPTNHVNGTNTGSSGPPDVNNINGLTEYVSVFLYS